LASKRRADCAPPLIADVRAHMKRRKSITAGELIAKLNDDPEYLARIAEQDRRIAKFVAEVADEEYQISRQAEKLGYKITSVWDFVNNSPHPILPRPFVGPYERAYPMLVRHLRLPHHPRIREGVIRALTVKDGGQLVSDALYQEFITEKDSGVKWVLANALRTAMPLKERKKHPEIAKVLKHAL
jgi:hypothetical protein